MCGLLRSPAIPPGLSMSECGAAGSASCCTACPFHSTIHHVSGSAELSESCLPQLPVSTPPTGLDECFFFISLVVRLPYSSIFCQFWLFFVFKLLSFRLCEEAQCVYLHLHLGQKLKKAIFHGPIFNVINHFEKNTSALITILNYQTEK